jgi:tRNA pseudouridine38-40 synthase
LNQILEPMPRYKIIIEYDGAPFVGWQLQEKDLSVQGAIMAAITAFSGEKVMVQGAGRRRPCIGAGGAFRSFG